MLFLQFLVVVGLAYVAMGRLLIHGVKTYGRAFWLTLAVIGVFFAFVAPDVEPYKPIPAPPPVIYPWDSLEVLRWKAQQGATKYVSREEWEAMRR